MLLSIGADSKTVKGNDVGSGYMTGILYLTQSEILCRNAANAGCLIPCLYDTGLATVFPSIKNARENKTDYFFNDRNGFMQDLDWSIGSLVRKAKRHHKTPVVRLSGTGDNVWETIPFVDSNGIFWSSIIHKWDYITFMDYTKMARISTLDNYHLTFSYSGKKEYQKSVARALRLNMHIAVVFRGPAPAMFLGKPVTTDGTKHDLRFLDSKGIVALKPLGKAVDDNSGFVVDTNIIAIAS